MIAGAALGVLLLALAGPAPPAWSATPTGQLRHTIDRVLRVANDPALTASQRDAALRRAVEARFDFDEAARQALGLAWRDRTPAERSRFTALFRELLERSYAARLAAYDAARVEYTGERVDGDHATVNTRVVTRQDTDVPIDYRLLRAGDGWRVYDVLVERVSLVDNYRTQFRDILARASYDALVGRITARVDALRAAGARPAHASGSTGAGLGSGPPGGRSASGASASMNAFNR